MNITHSNQIDLKWRNGVNWDKIQHNCTQSLSDIDLNGVNIIVDIITDDKYKSK